MWRDREKREGVGTRQVIIASELSPVGDETIVIVVCS